MCVLLASKFQHIEYDFLFFRLFDFETGINFLHTTYDQQLTYELGLCLWILC